MGKSSRSEVRSIGNRSAEAGGGGRRWAGFLVVAALLAGVAGGPFSRAEAQTPAPGTEYLPYTPYASPRGFQNDHPFEVGEFDAIDPASGNLVLTVPLGQTYTVGPQLSYRLQVVHNSHSWDVIKILCPGCPGAESIQFAMPNIASNAGLGWEIHFGKLYPPDFPVGLDAHQAQRWPNRPAEWASQDGLPWLYVDPSGARHKLVPSVAGGWESLDGTFIRMINDPGFPTTRKRVEFPDGTYTLFAKTGQKLGTEFCGGGITGCWRFFELRDRYGNFMRVTYSKPGATSTTSAGSTTDELWTVTDSTGRSHELHFTWDPAQTGGNDGYGEFQTPDGSEWGDSVRLLTHVEVAAFGGGTARYDFNYVRDAGGQIPRVTRACPHDYLKLDPQSTFGGYTSIATPVLESITVPQALPWEFETHVHAPGGSGSPCTVEERCACYDLSGRIAEVTLPTRGKVAYDYTAGWQVPTQCVFQPDPPGDPGPVDTTLLSRDYHTTAVRARKLFKADTLDPATGQVVPGGLIGEWTYSTVIETFPGWTHSTNITGPACRRADYRITTVDEPAGEDGKHAQRRYYFALFDGPETGSTGSIDAWQVTDNGLPYTKDLYYGEATPWILDQDGQRLFLSEQSYLCTGTSCSLEVSRYVRYAMEFRNCEQNVGDPPSCWKKNAQTHKERSVYDTDAGKFVQISRDRYNGAGRWEVEETADNFLGPLSLRTETTNFTATDTAMGDTVIPVSATTGYFAMGSPQTYLPSTSEPWILDPYDRITISEGSRTYTTEFEFDDQGSLVCSRKWRRPGSASTSVVRRASDDHVVQLLLGGVAGRDLGLPVAEIVAGGVGGNLSTVTLCDTRAGQAGSRYRIDNTYDKLTLASTRIGGFPYWYRATIDRNTGLPTALFNGADQKTSYSFDKLGRLKSVVPETSLSEARTDFTYNHGLFGGPTVDIVRKFGASTLSQEKKLFTAHGKLWKETRWRPVGVSGHAVSARQIAYDDAGRQVKVSTWQDEDVADLLQRSTHTERFDSLGRPGRITRPDGTTETLTYQGIRTTISKVWVRTTDTASTAVKSMTTRDAQGRDVQVRIWKPGDPTLMTTDFSYDPYGERVSATRTGGGLSQPRSWGYDARGLLLSETHPELGPGTLTFNPDAFGQPRRTIGAGRDLTHEYDGAGRPTKIRDALGRVWKSWAWGTTNLGTNCTTTGAGCNYRKGKLVEAVRHNYPFGGTDDYAVREQYAYQGLLGKLSTRTIQLLRPALGGNLELPDGPDEYEAHFFVNYGWDPLGNRTLLTYPECDELTPQNGRRYCAGGPGDVEPPAGHWVTSSYVERLPTRVSSTYAGMTTDFSYHPNFQLASTTHGNSVVETYDQGTSGLARPRRILFDRGATNLFSTGFYRYDAAGNVWGIGADRFVYDAANRLVSSSFDASGVLNTSSYTYDAADNMLTRRHNLTTLTYNLDASTNRLLGNDPQDVFYDAAGNIERVGFLADGVSPWIELEYDPFGLITNTTQFRDCSAGEKAPCYQSIVYFLYGPSNYRYLHFDVFTQERRVKIRDLDGKVLREFSVTGWGYQDQTPGDEGERWVFVKDYIYGPQGLLATRADLAVKRFFHADHLGTPRVITDAFGTVVGRHNYFPFGTEAGPGGAYDEPTVKFTGHERDAQGLTDYMLGRSYAFSFQRFVSPDPGRATNAWSLYAYAGNNPINVVDPNGLDGFKVTGDLNVSEVVASKISVGLAVDFSGNVNLLVSFGVGGGLGLSAGANLSYFTQDTANDLQGLSNDVDVDTVLGFGGEASVSFFDLKTQSFTSPEGSFGVQIGPGFNVSSTAVYTESINLFNIVDVVSGLAEGITNAAQETYETLREKVDPEELFPELRPK